MAVCIVYPWVLTSRGRRDPSFLYHHHGRHLILSPSPPFLATRSVLAPFPGIGGGGKKVALLPGVGSWKEKEKRDAGVHSLFLLLPYITHSKRMSCMAAATRSRGLERDNLLCFSHHPHLQEGGWHWHCCSSLLHHLTKGQPAGLLPSVLFLPIPACLDLINYASLA